MYLLLKDLEKASDEALLNDQDRPKGKARIFGGISKEARQYRQKILDFIEMYTPEGNMAVYGDWAAAGALRVDTASLDWDRLAGIKAMELEGPLPKQAKLSSPDDNQLEERRRIKNIYDPGMPGLEVVPAVEEVEVAEVSVPAELVALIRASKLERSTSSSSLKSMFTEEDSLRILPTLNEFRQDETNVTLTY